MRLLKKILRIIAIVLPCSLFFVTPSYALKYERDSVPYFIPHIVLSNGSDYSLGSPLSVDFDVRNAPDSSSFHPTAPWAFRAYKSGNNCVYGRGSSSGTDYTNWYYSGYGVTIGGSPYYLNSDSRLPESECLLLNSSWEFKGFGNDSLPSFDSSTIPLVGSPFTYNFRSFLPYNTDYSSWGFRYDSTVSDNTTYHYISDIDLFSISIDDPSNLILPLTFNSNSIGNIIDGRSIRFQGRFTFYGSENDPFLSGFVAQLHSNYGFVDNGSVIGQEDVSTCDIRTQVGNSSQAPLLWYDCEFTPTYDVWNNYVGFYIEFNTSNSLSSLWHAGCSSLETSCWGLSYNYIVTDNDNTPSDISVDTTPFGFSQNNAPGFAGFYSGTDGYVGQLSNLFDFSFLNPFSGLFALFTDSSSCVNIPILAGMLGSTETQYCPWFSSDVRNILTPVLGLASSMLLFGFCVHWLRSSSGNFLEDSDSKKGGK